MWTWEINSMIEEGERGGKKDTGWSEPWRNPFNWYNDMPKSVFTLYPETKSKKKMIHIEVVFWSRLSGRSHEIADSYVWYISITLFLNDIADESIFGCYHGYDIYLAVITCIMGMIGYISEHPCLYNHL